MLFLGPKAQKDRTGLSTLEAVLPTAMQCVVCECRSPKATSTRGYLCGTSPPDMCSSRCASGKGLGFMEGRQMLSWSVGHSQVT